MKVLVPTSYVRESGDPEMVFSWGIVYKQINIL